MEMQTASYAERLEFFKFYHATVLIGRAGWLMQHGNELESKRGKHELLHSIWTAFYIQYAKPFRHRKSTGIRLPEELVPGKFQEAHQELMTVRDKLVAHSDVDSFVFEDGHPIESIRV